MTTISTNLLNTFNEQIHVPIISLDLNGNFMEINKAAEQLFQHTNAELMGQPFNITLDNHSHEKAKLMLQNVIANGRVDHWELDHIQSGKQPILIGYCASLLRDSTKKPIGIVAIGQDLSNNIELTQKLAETNQKLEGALLNLEKTHLQLKTTQTQLIQLEKMRSLGQMVAGVAHEINNPLSYVSNNLTQLEELTPNLHKLFDALNQQRKFARPDELTAIENIETSLGGNYLWSDIEELIIESRDGINRIREIVLALRTFSRMDTSELVRADVNEGLKSTIKIAKSLFKQKIEVIELYKAVPLLLCHPGELNQIFLNLLTNASQAITEEGTIWVNSELRNDQIEITIRDNGHGMDKETLKRLGEPFFTTRPIGSGTGLGLAVCFGIIEKHQGQLTFTSKVGEGTTAKIVIPINQTHTLTSEN